MGRLMLIVISILIIVIQASCTTTAASPTSKISVTTATRSVEEAPDVTPTMTPSLTVLSPTEVPVEVAYPLAAPGVFEVGVRSYDYEEMGVDARAGGFTVWYPAVPPADAQVGIPAQNAPASTSSAPYPLLIASSKLGGFLGAHLASHGFVFVGMHRQDSKDAWGDWLLDFPRDILFGLDFIASHPLEGLEGLIDANRTGVMGYSFGGYDALAVSGARVDPDFYLDHCASAADRQPPLDERWIAYTCALTAGWDAFVTHASPELTQSDDGLWQPVTDERIRAVMPMVPEGAWLFGEKGLAAVDRPLLIIGATKDTINDYDLEAVPIFEWSAGPDREMISFVDSSHMIIYSEEPKSRLQHFAVAFFGYHLQDRADYRPLYSEEFVKEHKELAWGTYVENDKD